MATLDELRASKARREETRKAKGEALEKEALELEEKYSENGEAGIDFAVVTTSIGNFVVGKPEFVTAKRFSDKKGDRTTEDIVQFVMPCVLHPDRTAMTSVFQAHGGIAWKLATALMSLYEADASAYMGK